MAVLSVHGERVSLQDPWAGFRDELEREGIVFLADSLPADDPFPEMVSGHVARAVVHLRALGDSGLTSAP